MDVYLETDRLVLRRFTAGDVELLVELDSDLEVMRYLTGQPTPRDEIERKSRRVMIKSGHRFGRVFHLHFDDPLPGTEHGEVEYAVDRTAWLSSPLASD